MFTFSYKVLTGIIAAYLGYYWVEQLAARYDLWTRMLP